MAPLIEPPTLVTTRYAVDRPPTTDTDGAMKAKLREITYSGSARVFTWHEVHDTDRFLCACGWSGTMGELVIEGIRELVDGPCPQCDRMLMIRSFPTIDEMREAAARGDWSTAEDVARVARADTPTNEPRPARASSPEGGKRGL